MHQEGNARLLHSKGRIELLHGEEFGIKVNAYPGTQALMIVVARIAEGFEQLVVPGDATAVFWRAGPPAIETSRRHPVLRIRGV